MYFKLFKPQNWRKRSAEARRRNCAVLPKQFKGAMDAMDMKVYCRRLHRGDDLLAEIRRLAQEEHLEAGVVVSAVGCVSRARIRDASGVHVREVNEHCEIVSLNGTVSAARCHLHIALSKEDLSTVGGHLLPGCIVNTTCELIVAPLRGWRFGTEQDAQTGYDEIVFEETNAGEEA